MIYTANNSPNDFGVEEDLNAEESLQCDAMQEREHVNDG